ncbi:ABC transporter ATP-binding protein [Sporosarcina thermotolerans]|uniref:ABC transporter ATP-binding protein n=1 Tax=Sporosarcina thermotolerans TaxID=633404 RepID=A0AAW9AAM2_9BACL|nr:ABC transporter ATP-binding protein [Sporosarcina thermotolerans]MDW0118696.1 ABC transporter ATP-binding protein [Sporosarcina thermotolerans]WHT48659.1 ABC transporter ATP-binding protein [Sporosarcina thermotolerans]
MKKHILEINQLTKSYSKQSILNNINLFLQEKDVYALVGKNGSGKTTLLSTIAGITKPNAGSIHLQQPDIGFQSVSIAYQSPSLYPYLNCKENLYLLTKEPSIALEILKRLNPLDNILVKKVKNLSFGQKQRLGLAIALSKRASLYLLDEPSNGLDIESYNNLIKVINDMSSNGSTFIIASHEWGIIEECCNRLGVIFNGTIIKELRTERTKLTTIQLKTPTTFTSEEFNSMVFCPIREWRGIYNGLIKEREVIC